MIAADAARRMIALGRLSGIVLALSVLTQLMLASRMPVIVRTFGADMWRIHRYVGYSIGASLVAHILLLISGYALREGTGAVSQFMVFITYWEGIWYALIGTLAMLTVIILSLPWIRVHLRYEIWYASHLLVYGGILLAFIHQIATGDFADGAARTYWSALFAFVCGMFLLYRVAVPVLLFARHRFRISRIVRESPSTISIYITGKNMGSFFFTPGQYAHFTFLRSGFAHHPFSFSQPYNGTELRVTTKALGDDTARFDELRPGTMVFVDGPMGAFTLDAARTSRYCFVAGGVGITPIAGMVRSLPDPAQAVVFVSNRTTADAPLLNEIAATGATLHTYATSEGSVPLTAAEVLARCPDARERDVFICGPAGMMQALSTSLAAA